jgi:hypothetical protein
VWVETRHTTGRSRGGSRTSLPVVEALTSLPEDLSLRESEGLVEAGGGEEGAGGAEAAVRPRDEGRPREEADVEVAEGGFW